MGIVMIFDHPVVGSQKHLPRSSRVSAGRCHCRPTGFIPKTLLARSELNPTRYAAVGRIGDRQLPPRDSFGPAPGPDWPRSAFFADARLQWLHFG